MKKKLIILTLIGLSIGVGQLFFIWLVTQQDVQKINKNNPVCQAITPECGKCDSDERAGYCYYPPYKQKVRGFPFTSNAYGIDSRTDITRELYINVILWASLVLAVGYVVIKLKNKKSK